MEKLVGNKELNSQVSRNQEFDDVLATHSFDVQNGGKK